MGIATYSYNRSTSGGEIIRELVNASDGQGLHFVDGGYIQTVNSAGTEFGTSDFSIEFILNRDSENSADEYIYFTHTSGNNRFRFLHDISEDKIKLTFINSGGIAASYSIDYDIAADLNTPTHYALTCDRDGLATLYKNGNSVGTISISGSSGVDIGSSNTSLGQISSTATYGFIGTLYRFRTWNKSLTSAEVTASYENATVPFADQYGTQTYIIDSSFASSTQSFNGAGGTTAANIDSIGGQNDTLRFTTDSATANHQILRVCPRDKGKNVRVQGMVYIPSTNTNIKKVQINESGTADIAVIKEITTLDAWVTFDEIHVWTDYDELRFRGLKADGTSNYAGNGSDVFYIKNIKVNYAGCVADYDLAFANPTQSDQVQDRSTNLADGTASSGVTQVTPIEQLNSKSARIGTTAATPADGDIVADQVGAGIVPAVPLHAKLAATTGSSPLEVARLEVKDEGVNLIAGMGPKQSFYMPHSTASFEGASIAAKKEDGTDASEATMLAFSTCPDAGSNTERMTIDSAGLISIGIETFTAHDHADDLVIKPDETNTGITIRCKGGGGTGSIFFANTSLNAVGQIRYNHNTDNMAITAADEINFTCDLATFSNGIALGNTGTASTGTPSSPAQTLDWYETGTFSPVPKDNQATVVATSVALGSYVRVGKIVYCTYRLVRNDTQSLANTLYLYGLPFTSQNNVQTKNIGVGTSWFPNDTYAGFNYALENTDQWIIRKNDATGYATTNVWSNGQELIGTLTYEADA